MPKGTRVKNHKTEQWLVRFTFIQTSTIPAQSLAVSFQAAALGFSDMQWCQHMTVAELKTSIANAQARLALRREGGEGPVSLAHSRLTRGDEKHSL